MLLGKIGKISSYTETVDIVFRHANKAAEEEREKVKGKLRIDKSRGIELTRIRTVTSELNRIADRIIKNFPSFDNLNMFYQEMLRLRFDTEQIKKSLGALQWMKETVARIEREVGRKIKDEKSFRDINPFRRQFYARVDSIVKKVASDFILLEKVRKYLRDMPVLKERMFTVSIVGFPNVGKTTLLSKLTGSTPEISPIPFTTQRLNLGYYKKLIQFVDTPGTLHHFEEMNEVEKLAYLAMKYVSHVIVYIYDATEPYPWTQQEALDTEIKKLNKPLIYFLSKDDLLSAEKIAELKKNIKGLIIGQEELIQKVEELERNI